MGMTTPEPPDEFFKEQIAKAEARQRELTAHRDDLQAKADAARRKRDRDRYWEQRLSQTQDENRRLEREIAGLEGRPYCEVDEDDPYAERPDPPDPPDA